MNRRLCPDITLVGCGLATVAAVAVLACTSGWAAAASSARDTSRQMARSGEPVWPSDRTISRTIRNAIFRDPRLQSPIRVRVYDGEVTLIGLVDNPEAKEAAEDHAANTPGVIRVRNLLRVGAAERRPGADDAAITDRVRAALNLTPFFDPSHVHVSVTDGIVLLTGIAHSQFERLRAEYAAFPVDGVREVINQIEVISLRAGDRAVNLDLERELPRTGY